MRPGTEPTKPMDPEDSRLFLQMGETCVARVEELSTGCKILVEKIATAGELLRLYEQLVPMPPGYDSEAIEKRERLKSITDKYIADGDRVKKHALDSIARNEMFCDRARATLERIKNRQEPPAPPP